MSRPARWALTAGMSAFVVLVPSGADAARWSGEEPDMDVRVFTHDPDPEPCGTYTELDGTANTTNDITRLAVAHGTSSLRIAVSFRDLVVGNRASTEVILRTPTGKYLVDTATKTSGEVRIDFSVLPRRVHPDECGAFSFATSTPPCPRMTATSDSEADVVRVLVPRSCIGSPEWVRAAARDFSRVGGVASSDQWSPDDVEGGTWGFFGPRVHAG